MRSFFPAIVATGLVLLTACSDSTTDSSGTSGTPGTSGQPGQSTSTINGKPAAEYYAQFAFETTKTDLEGAAAIPTQANGNNAFLANLFLKKDGSFVLFYVEGQGEVTFSGHSINYDKKQGRKVTGSWTLDDASLVAGPLRCNGLTIDGKDTLDCGVTSAIVSPGAVGKSGTFSKGFRDASPGDSDFADYK